MRWALPALAWLARSTLSAPPCSLFAIHLLCRNQRRRLERLAYLLVLLHAREGLRHVLRGTIPQLDLHQGVRAGDRVRRPGLGALGRKQVEAPSPIDGFPRLAHGVVHRGRLVAMADAAG